MYLLKDPTQTTLLRTIRPKPRNRRIGLSVWSGLGRRRRFHNRTGGDDVAERHICEAAYLEQE